MNSESSYESFELAKLAARGISRLQSLNLTNFKNFRKAYLSLGPLTLIVGANASGKSNIRDSFRFLHGVSRSYNLSEIIGEKWGEGGVLQWQGIRGGTRESAFIGSSTFALEVKLSAAIPKYLKLDHSRIPDVFTQRGTVPAIYRIEVEVNEENRAPKITRESLAIPLFSNNNYVFDSHPGDEPVKQKDDSANNITVRCQKVGTQRKPYVNLSFSNQVPVLSQFANMPTRSGLADSKVCAQAVMQKLGSMRFLDLNPDSMRMPSFPGQNVLGDRGENLSSVLQEMSRQPERKEVLLQWIRELTPMDAVDLEFVPDQIGRVLVTLVEKGDKKISAYSASDGTLRFLAMLAALLGSQTEQFYFFVTVQVLVSGISDG